MSSLLIYILSTSVCLALFVLAYQIFLRNNTRFNLCRFYLISAILLSFLIPSIPIDLGISLIHKAEQKTPQIEVESLAMRSSQQIVTGTADESGFTLNIDYLATLGITLLSISLLLFIRFIYRFGSIILIRTSGHKSEKVEDFKLIFTDKTNNAFSFLGYIFINPLKFNDEEKRLIIEHEREHIRHFHSIDLILIELLIVMQWFNPFAYIARRKLIEIHEFIADNGVIRNGADPHSYQTLLLSVVTSSCLPTAGNQLSALITKKRIAMIGKPMNQTGRWINFLILVPIAAILVIGISAFTVKESENIDTKEDIVIPESQPSLLTKTDRKINKPIVIENKNNSTLEVESKNSRLDGYDLKPISRKDAEVLNQNLPKEEKLNIALKEKNAPQSIRDELLKRAKDESKYTFLKDLYFNLPPNGYSEKSSEDVTRSYSLILKKECIYSIEYVSGSKDDNLEAIIGTGRGDESIIVKQFKFSFSNKITFAPEVTGAYHLEIRNLSSKSAEALILLTLAGETRNSIESKIDNDSILYQGLKKRAIKEVKGIQLADFFIDVDPKRFNLYTVTLKKGCEYNFNLIANNNNDNFKAILSRGKLNSKVIKVMESKVSNSYKLNFTPTETGYYVFTLENISSNKTPALMVLTYNGEKNNISEWGKSDFPGIYEGLEKADKVYYQEKKTQQQITDTLGDVFFVVEVMPTFNGGDAQTEFTKYISANLKYPDQAVKNGIQGKVYIQFIIEKDGRITNAKVIRSANPLLDKEALNIIKNSPKWEPGMQRGQAVRVSYTFPISFVLN